MPTRGINKISVLIVDDHPPLRTRVRAKLEDAPDIEEYSFMKSSTRIELAFSIALFVGVPVSFFNRGNLFFSLQSGFVFAVIVATIVAMLSWGIDIAVRKGYPAWMGFLLVLLLNVFGLLLLVLLPAIRLSNSDQA